jgi:CHASE2 domain-containing sensor protein
VVLATTQTSPSGEVDILGGNRVLRSIGAKPGYSAFPTDLEDAIRRPVYAVEGLQSFAVATATTAAAHSISPHAFDRAWLDYYGPPGTIRSVSFTSVMRGRIPAGYFRGKIVVVGTTSRSLGDYHWVSGSNRMMPGVEIHATAIESVLRHLPIKDAPDAVNYLIILIVGLLPALLARNFALTRIIAVAVGAAMLWLFAAQLAFDSGMMLSVAYPLALLFIATLAVLLVGAVSPQSDLKDH